jgi:hypothetical protein
MIWIHLAHDRDKWRSLVEKVVCKKYEEFD